MADALGFPDATDTGVSAGVTLKAYNGTLIINTPGVVISGLDIHGSVIINADNVTLKDCRITTNDFWGVSVGGGGSSTGGSGCIIENCEINGLGTGTGATAIVGGGTFLANNIYGFENGIMIDQSNTLVQDNYIHDLKGLGDPHYDGIAMHGGGFSNITIRHNTVINQNTQTSALYITNDFGSITNVIVDNNKLIGGGYTVYSDEKASKSGQITGVQFTNNYLSKGYYGFADITNNTVVWQGNIDLSTSRFVSQDGILSSLNSQLAITAFSTDSGTAGDHITNDNTLTLTGTAAANGTVKVFDGANQIGTATANSSGAWTYTTAALAEGSHSLTAKDNAGTTSTALSVTIDTVAPSTPSIVSNTISSNKVTLNGTAEANSTVQVFEGSTQLGTATTNSSGTWTFTTATLTTGAHNFTAKAMDAAGNNSGASTATSVTVGTTTQAPGAPTISSFSPDTGIVGDGITDPAVLTLTGTAVANSTVNVYDGGKLLGTTTANGGGAWSFVTAALPDGLHKFTATDTVSGTTSAASAALAVTVDTVAPAVPVIGSNSVSPTNVVTLSGTAEANSTVTVFDGTTQLGTATANTSGVWSYATAALSAGSHSFTAKDADAAGNTSAVSSNLNLTLTAVPVNLVAQTASWSNFSYPTQTTNFTASFDAAPSQSGADIVIGLAATNAAAYTDLAAIVRFNDTNTIDVRNGSGYGADVFVPYSAGTNYHFRMVVNPSTHTYSVYVTPQGRSEIALATNYAFRAEQATDTSLSDVGGFSTSGSAAVLNFSIVSALPAAPTDTAAPAAPTIASFSTDSGTVGDHITNDATLTLTGTAEANSTVNVLDGAKQLGSASANASGAWSYTTAALANGAHSLTATASDAAANTGAASAALSVTIDTVAPSTPSIVSNTINSGKVTLNGTAEANSTVQVFEGSTQLGTATTNSSGAWTFTTATLTIGAHNFTAKAMDAAGNNSAASAATSVTIGTTTQAPGAPTITSFSPDTGIVGDGITDPAVLTLTGKAVANSTVNVYDGANLLGTTTANGSGAWSFVTVALPDGLHKFTATDTVSGTTSAASSTLNVTIDTVAPVIPVIASISNDTGKMGDRITSDNTLTLTGTAEANSTVTVYDGAKLLGSAVANGSGAWSYTTEALVNGAHSLTATASDAAANTGAASTALSVTIDTVAPVAPVIASFSTDSGTVGDHITNDSTLTLTGTAEANSTVNVYDSAKLLGSAVANGSGAWTYTTAALANGAHSLSATANDAAGNAGAASAALSVTIDTTAPGAPGAPGKPAAPGIVSISTDTGAVGDHITSDSTLTLTGTAVANSTVKVFDDAKVLGSATVDGGGHWSYTTVALADGTHNLTATDTNGGGTSAASNALSITVDTIAPASPVLFANVHVGSNVFMFGTSEPNSTVSIFDDANGKLVGTALTAATGIFNFTSFSNTATNFDLTATDIAGNIGGSSPKVFNNFAGVLADAAHAPDVVAPAGAADPTTSILKNDIHIV